MEFRISDTFTDSLARLTAEEQKAAKTTAFDLQLNPAQPGLQFHKLDKVRDPNFWSVRVSRDIRLIVHRTERSLLLCYVDHHDKAYAWAQRRKLETHPKTGAAQFVEIRERVQEIVLPAYVAVAAPARPKPLLFSDVTEDTLLGYGVPLEWVSDVHQATEDSLLELADHLPSEAAEALLELATGGRPMPVPPPQTIKQDSVIKLHLADGVRVQDNVIMESFNHPDAQRRFRVIGSVEELARALDYPWEKWTIFLHPAQRQLVEQDYSGPARVSGSAGTGKTIVALHRAVFLARSHPDARVLLTTFSETLANALRGKLRRLISNEPRLAERLEVHAIDAVGRRLYESLFVRLQLASAADIDQLLVAAAKLVGALRFSAHFLSTEWTEIVDAWQLATWEDYRDVRRLGRKTRVPESQRQVLWGIFDAVRKQIESSGQVTAATMLNRVAAHLFERKHPPYDFAVVDEAQDINVPQLRFLAALGGDRLNSLFFAGDLGQRIFQLPFSWKALGVDIRGRSRTLHVNYRTSHQIRTQADRLLGPELADVDGNTEERRGTVSLFNGPPPRIQVLDGVDEEIAAVANWLIARSKEGVAPHEVGVFVRSETELERARAAVERVSLPFKVLDEHVETTSGHVSISTMHLAKGLEFRSVVVMACDDEVIPLQARIESVSDDTDLEEVYNTERHLLYVACTRARDHLLVTGVEPASEFLDDLRL